MHRAGARSDILLERPAGHETQTAALDEERQAAEQPAPVAIVHPAAAEGNRNKAADLEAAPSDPEMRAERRLSSEQR